MGNTAKMMYDLRLYIFGRTDKAESAVRSLERICSKYLENSCTFEVIDLAESPERAQLDCILATPTLIRRQPTPESRIIGDLSRTADVLAFLDIDPKK